MGIFLLLFPSLPLSTLSGQLQGKELICKARNQRNRYRLYDIYHARQEDCANCPLKLRCLSKPDIPFRYLSVRLDEQTPNLIDEMKAKIDPPEGKKIYARRLATLAPHAVQVTVGTPSPCPSRGCRQSRVPSLRNVLERLRFPIHDLEYTHCVSPISQGVPRTKR